MNASWTHRFFWCQKSAGKFKCRFQIKNANFWLPRSFVWTNGNDPDSLRAYIDALTDRNATVTTLWEDKGIAIDLEYQEEPAGGVVRLDPMKLAAFLRGEYVLEVPCYGRLITSEGGKNDDRVFMPLEVQAPLLAASGEIHDLYVQRLRALVGSGAPIMCLTKEELSSDKAASHNLKTWNANGNIAVNSQTSTTPAASTEAHEVEISTIDHGVYIERIVSVADYFIRRLTVKDKPFWTGSSYKATGPWQPFFVDQAIYDVVFQPEAAQ